MISLNEKLIQSSFVASDAQIEALAVTVRQGNELSGTYLKCLTAAIQAALGKSRRKVAPETQVAAVNKIHGGKTEGFFGSVCRGLQAGGELAQAELYSQARFALSAASALRCFAAEGGDIRTLDVPTLTRRQIRPERGETVPAGTSKAESIMLRAQSRIISVAERVAKKDRGEARRLLEDLIDKLSTELDTLADGNVEPTRSVEATVVQHALRRGPQPATQYHKAA